MNLAQTGNGAVRNGGMGLAGRVLASYLGSAGKAARARRIIRGAEDRVRGLAEQTANGDPDVRLRRRHVPRQSRDRRVALRLHATHARAHTHAAFSITAKMT